MFVDEGEQVWGGKVIGFASPLEAGEVRECDLCA
jgi:hypothetical protein